MASVYDIHNTGWPIVKYADCIQTRHWWNGGMGNIRRPAILPVGSSIMISCESEIARKSPLIHGYAYAFSLLVYIRRMTKYGVGNVN